jgi:hypothetical protein
MNNLRKWICLLVAVMALTLANASFANIVIMGFEDGLVNKVGDYKYEVDSPTGGLTVKIREDDSGQSWISADAVGQDTETKLPSGTLKPVTIKFSGWKCGVGVDRLYQRAKAVIHQKDWPKKTLEDILNAITEGKATPIKYRSPVGYNVMATARKFLKEQFTSFVVTVSPKVAVPSPGHREIKSCYTTSEMANILNAVEQAVRRALKDNSKSDNSKM